MGCIIIIIISASQLAPRFNWNWGLTIETSRWLAVSELNVHDAREGHAKSKIPIPIDQFGSKLLQ